MPALPNVRHERFAQALAKGEAASKAYADAGYKPDRGHATRLAAHGSIRQRVAELQATTARQGEITREGLIAWLEALAEYAAERGQCGGPQYDQRDRGACRLPSATAAG